MPDSGRCYHASLDFHASAFTQAAPANSVPIQRPEKQSSVGTAGERLAAAGCNGNGLNPHFVTFQPEESFLTLHVPDADPAVVAPRQNERSILGDGDAPDGPLVFRELRKLLTRLYVPDS